MIYGQANPYALWARQRARGVTVDPDSPLAPPEGTAQARQAAYGNGGGGWGGLVPQSAGAAPAYGSTGASPVAQEARARAAGATAASAAAPVDPETVPRQSRQERQQARRDARWDHYREVRDRGGHLPPGVLRQLELQDRARATADARRRADESLNELDLERRQLSDPAGQARFLAPRREQAEAWRESARGELARGMAARGIEDSSYAAAAAGGLESDFAQGMAGLNAQWGDQAQARHDMLNDLYTRLVEARRSGDAQLIQAALNDLSQFRLQMKQLEMANQTDWGAIAQAYIQAAGTAAGGA